MPYRDADWLRGEVERLGSINQVAQQHGIPRATLQRWWHKHQAAAGNAEHIDRVVDLARMRQQLERRDAELRSLKAQVKQLARYGNVIDDVRELLAPVIDERVLPKPRKPRLERSRDRKPLAFVWHLTDLHWGEIVDPRTINGLNAYSPEIAARRVQHAVDTILKLADNYTSTHGVDEIVVAVNGDTVGGTIHPESADYYARIGKQTLDAATVIAQVGYELASSFNRVRFLCTVGNHPRSTHRMPTGGARISTSWETLLHEFTAALLSKADNVAFELAEGYTLDTYIGPSRWAFSHGDAVAGGGGQLGIPAYGLKKQHDANREWSLILASMTDDALSNSIVKHTRTGHFHTYFQWQAGAADIALAPSPKGVDPFVKDKLGRYSPAMFLLEVVHPEHDVMASHLIDVQHVMDDTEPCRYTWGALETAQPVASMI
jgi:hypothetical protein